MMSSMNTTSYHDHHFLDSSEMSRPQTSSSGNPTFSKKDQETDRLPEAESGPVPLPNYVENYQKGDYWGQSGAPVKTAGDVSLSGKQLMPFLIKASLRLPEVKAAGVQLRLRQLTQLIEEGRLSDIIIKRLNFVVDALDRENYQEAFDYFEGLKNNYPEETASNWANGLNLLIRELLPRQRKARVGSAGSHLRNQ